MRVRKFLCLALMALMILAAVPAMAGAKPTEEQFLYRYTALLGIAGEGLDSSAGPKTIDTLDDGSRAIMVANCMIIVDPSDNVKQAGVCFPDKTVEPKRGVAFLLALDTDFAFDAQTQVLDQVNVVETLANIMQSNDVEYCGYKMQYTTTQGVPMFVAQ